MSPPPPLPFDGSQVPTGWFSARLLPLGGRQGGVHAGTVRNETVLVLSKERNGGGSEMRLAAIVRRGNMGRAGDAVTIEFAPACPAHHAEARASDSTDWEAPCMQV